jgi:hypothetical protein
MVDITTLKGPLFHQVNPAKQETEREKRSYKGEEITGDEKSSEWKAERIDCLQGTKAVPLRNHMFTSIRRKAK